MKLFTKISAFEAYYGAYLDIPLAGTVLPFAGFAGPPSDAIPSTAAPTAGGSGFIEPPKIRKEFPETWIWEDLEDIRFVCC